MKVFKEKPLDPILKFESSRQLNKIQFEDIFSFISTNSFSRDMLNYNDGEVRNIHYGDIHTKFQTLFNLENENVPIINADIKINKFRKEQYCKEGDLIIADAAEDYEGIGKHIEITSLNGKKTLAGLHTIHARPKEKFLHSGFGAYIMQSWSVRYQLMKIAQGTKVLGISSKRLGKITLNIPSLYEQKKIASFLSAVDEKLQQLTKKKELIEDYKKGIMQKIFSQEIRFKDDSGNNYPNWEEKKLGELDIFNSDGNYGELYPKASEMKQSGVPFIRANNIKNLRLIWDNMRFIDDKLHSVLTSGHLKTNDILITTRGEIGKVALVTEDFDGANINAQICLLRTGQNLNPQFLLQFLASLNGKKQFKKLQTGSALKQLPKSNLMQIKLKTPEIEEQKKIADFLTAIDKKIDLVSTQIEKTKEFKKGLLQQMFV